MCLTPWKAKDIRGIVQQYNLERGKAVQDVQVQRAAKRLLDDDEPTTTTVADIYASLDPSTKAHAPVPQPSKEKWAGLLEDSDHSVDDDSELAAQGFVTSLPAKEIEGKKKRRAQSASAARGPAKAPAEADDEKVATRDIPSKPAAQPAARRVAPAQHIVSSAPRSMPPAPRAAPAPAVAARVYAPPAAPSPLPKPAAVGFPVALGKPAAAAPQKVVPSEGPPRKPPPAAAAPASSAKWGDLLPSGEDSGQEDDASNDGMVLTTRGGEEAL